MKSRVIFDLVVVLILAVAFLAFGLPPPASAGCNSVVAGNTAPQASDRWSGGWDTPAVAALDTSALTVGHDAVLRGEIDATITARGSPAQTRPLLYLTSRDDGRQALLGETYVNLAPGGDGAVVSPVARTAHPLRQ